MRHRECLITTSNDLQDVSVPLSDMVPPLANISPPVALQLAEQPLLPVSVSGDRQFFLSWRHGNLVDKATLRRLLDGRLTGNGSQHPDQGTDWWRDPAETDVTAPTPGALTGSGCKGCNAIKTQRLTRELEVFFFLEWSAATF